MTFAESTGKVYGCDGHNQGTKGPNKHPNGCSKGPNRPSNIQNKVVLKASICCIVPL